MTTYKQYDVVLTVNGDKATIYQQETDTVYTVWIAGWGMSYLHITKIVGLVK